MLFFVNKFSGGNYYVKLKNNVAVAFLAGWDKWIYSVQAIWKSDISNITDSFLLHVAIKQRHVGNESGLLLYF